MLPVLGFLGQCMVWISGALIARWIIIKVFVIGCLVVVVPWVIKDGFNWFWQVTESQRSTLLSYFNDLTASLLSNIDPHVVIKITSIGGYIANQIGLSDYIAIIVTAMGICWGYKLAARFL